ncbi:hypothetical protein GCM10011506_38950 [Marivirga lumbricoides]|nr:hypothetical protein GCM10011506_38950 [Marivirga lumbricoides]
MLIFQKQLSSDNIKSHLVHLHQLSKIDSKVVNEERQFLFELGRKNGLSEEAVQAIIIEAEDHPFLLPEGRDERLLFMYEYIQMMLVDNKLDEREARMCTLIAEKMEFNYALVGSITNAIVLAQDENEISVLTPNELNMLLNTTTR